MSLEGLSVHSSSVLPSGYNLQVLLSLVVVRMRIAYFSDVFLPKVDGVVTSLVTLSAELGKRGHEITIFCPGPGRGKRIVWGAKNVTVYPVASMPTFYPDFRLGTPSGRFLLRLRELRADVIHLHSPGPLGFEALAGGRLLRIPIVGTFHAYLMEPEYLKIVRLSRFKRVSKTLWRYVIAFFNRCDYVIAPTAFVAEDLRAHGLVKPQRVVSNGVDLSIINGVSAQAVRSVKKQFGLGDAVVLYVGRLSQEKNLTLLIAAFERVARQFPQAQLVFVGDGPMRSRLMRLAKKLQIENRVLFTGQIEHRQLLSSGIYQSSLVFCTPSTSETQGLSVMEAAGARLPIVGANARGVKELVDGNGILVEGDDIRGFSEGIMTFLGSERRRRQASKLSRKMARRYSIDRVAKTMERVYASVIE